MASLTYLSAHFICLLSMMISLTKDKAVATLSCFTLAGCFISELCGFGIGRILSPIKQYNLVLAMLFGWEEHRGPGICRDRGQRSSIDYWTTF